VSAEIAAPVVCGNSIGVVFTVDSPIGAQSPPGGPDTRVVGLVVVGGVGHRWCCCESSGRAGTHGQGAAAAAVAWSMRLEPAALWRGVPLDRAPGRAVRGAVSPALPPATFAHLDWRSGARRTRLIARARCPRPGFTAGLDVGRLSGSPRPGRRNRMPPCSWARGVPLPMPALRGGFAQGGLQNRSLLGTQNPNPTWLMQPSPSSRRAAFFAAAGLRGGRYEMPRYVGARCAS
jgi:hypothetical protein